MDNFGNDSLRIFIYITQVLVINRTTSEVTINNFVITENLY